MSDTSSYGFAPGREGPCDSALPAGGAAFTAQDAFAGIHFPGADHPGYVQTHGAGLIALLAVDAASVSALRCSDGQRKKFLILLPAMSDMGQK